MRRSQLQTKYFKNKSQNDYLVFKKQRNFCSKLYKKERKNYYNSLDMKNITDNKQFWKTIKPFLSEKIKTTSKMKLKDQDKIISNDDKVAEEFSTFFENANLTKNYRPVSVLPIVSKIFERLLQKQTISYIDQYLSNFLCGYRQGYSTQTALISMLEKWRNILDNKGYSGEILMDLSKAFDTINHELHLAKLHAYGFSEQALLILSSYLSNRKQRVKINNTFSSWTDLIQSIPQGSVLAPLLFNI